MTACRGRIWACPKCRGPFWLLVGAGVMYATILASVLS